MRRHAGLAGRSLTQRDLEVWQEVERVLMAMMLGVQIHLDVREWDQLRQAFAVMNLNQKKASSSLGHSWDMNNPLNAWLRANWTEVFGEASAMINTSDDDQHKIRFDDDKGAMALRDAVGICTLIVKGNLSPKGITPAQMDLAAPAVIQFWSAVRRAGVFSPDAKKASILAQPAALKGIANLIYQLCRTHRKDPAALSRVLPKVLGLIDASNPVWQHSSRKWSDKSLWALLDDGYQTRKRADLENKSGTSVWTVVASGQSLGDTTRKFGGVVYRFGSQTNDIRRVVADVLRWHLDLPPRTRRAGRPRRRAA